MTKQQKVEAIYRAKPELVNDDIGLIYYLLVRCGADDNLEKALRKLGNPEHWTRAARLARAKHPEWVSDTVKEERHREYVDYKYNAKAHINVFNY